MEAGTLLRIGELSRRSGVSPELLRAWEQRYGLLRPTRSAGGLRLYSLGDLDRVRRMQAHLAEGVAAAEAAALASRRAANGAAARPSFDAAHARQELADALSAFDEPRAQAVLHQVLALATVDAVLAEVVLPYLRELGERWARREATVADEHFASSVLRGRLFGLARGWGRGLGALALLACLPGEQHELGLVSFGLALRARGWRIAYLGADTPLATLAETARSLAPALVVVNATMREVADAAASDLRRLARDYTVAIGGPGAHDDVRAFGAVALTEDPVSAAERVTADRL